MIIALAGPMKSGKGTVAWLIHQLDPSFHVMAIADSLKEAYAQRNDVPLSDLYHPERKEPHRRGLQLLSEVMKETYENPYYFIDETMDRAKFYQNVVIEDARFPEEFERLQAKGAKIVKVQTKRELRIERGANQDTQINAHASEWDIPLGTILAWNGFILYNNGTVQELKEKVKNLLYLMGVPISETIP